MSTSLDEQIEQLKRTIAEMEAQRPVLGDETVEAALNPFRQKLTELEARSQPVEDRQPDIPTRQRKLVTLLYMDVVGSTAMTQHLDPEDTLEIMDNALPRLAEPVEAHGGHVTRYTGDGFKAVFGDPVARENDPEQAIRAGLEILEVSKALAKEIEKEWDIEEFQVRVGIDTGLAALGGQTEAEDTVMGRVVNLAVRIESAAPPGGLLISHNTYRHVRGIFTVEPQEPIIAKGFPEPVDVYVVKEIKPRAFRVQTRGVEGVETRMVGRRTELDTLKDALLTTFEEGEGQVVTIFGEAGVGKSRLLYEFDNWFELLPISQAVRFFQGRGRHEAQGSPYNLLRDVFAFRFQISDDDTGEQARGKIGTGFGEVFGTESDGMMRAHILGQLLGFDFSASPHLKGVLNDAEQLRNRGVMYLIQYFQKLSQEMPVVIFLEDIHWGDDSSLDVVNRIGEFTPQHPILFVCAARPRLFERRPYWGEGQPYHTCIELRPLSKRESRQLVAEILKLAVDIPAELRELIVRGAEGNPFYTEELIKMLIEDGVVIPDEETWQINLNRLEQIDMPSTLAGVLQARLDSLPSHERTVLQQASVVGRLFWDRIVTFIQAEEGDSNDPELIPQALTSLRNRELIYRHEESVFVGAIEYLFKHDVLREVTYESVLKRLRKSYHGLVANWLIANSGDRISEYSGTIAEHLLYAGNKETACMYFTQAGDSALDSYANSEAEMYFRQALDLFPQDSLKAKSLNGLGEALWRQAETDEAKSSWKEAINLHQKMGNSNQFADIYSRLSNLTWHTDDYLKAWNICQEGLEIMKGAPDSSGYARLLAEGGRTAWFGNINAQIVPLCMKAIEMAERLGDIEVAADAKITLAYQEDDISKTIDILREVSGLSEENDLLMITIRAQANLGGLYLSILDPSTSIQHSVRALQIGKQIGENTLYGLANLVQASIQLGKISDAENVLMSEISIINAPTKEKEIIILLNRGRILFARGIWDKSLEAVETCLDLLQEGESIQLIGNRNLEMAKTLIELHHFKTHRTIHKVEKALLENLKYNHDVPISCFLLATICALEGKFQASRDWLVRARDDRGIYENKSERSVHLLANFELARVESRWVDALAACEASIDLYQNGGDLWGYARVLIDLGDALVGRDEPGDLERARETYQQSLDMFTEMGAPGYIKVLEERLGELTSH